MRQLNVHVEICADEKRPTQTVTAILDAERIGLGIDSAPTFVAETIRGLMPEERIIAIRMVETTEIPLT